MSIILHHVYVLKQKHVMLYHINTDTFYQQLVRSQMILKKPELFLLVSTEPQNFVHVKQGHRLFHLMDDKHLAVRTELWEATLRQG